MCGWERERKKKRERETEKNSISISFNLMHLKIVPDQNEEMVENVTHNKNIMELWISSIMKIDARDDIEKWRMANY